MQRVLPNGDDKLADELVPVKSAIAPDPLPWELSDGTWTARGGVSSWTVLSARLSGVKLAPPVYSQSELGRGSSEEASASRFFLYVTAMTTAPTHASAPKMMGTPVVALNPDESPELSVPLESLRVSTAAVDWDADDADAPVFADSDSLSGEVLRSDVVSGLTVADALEGASVDS